MSLRSDISGPCGPLEYELLGPDGPARGAAVVCHPHPLYGGTMDNTVVRIVQQRFVARGLLTVRFNFRGVGQSAGGHDQGRGEQDDLRAVIAVLEQETDSRPWIAGYSFGAAVALSLLERPDLGLPGVVALAPPLEHYDFSFLERNDVPLAIVYGDRDELTPEAALAAAREGWAGLRAVECIPGAGHDLSSSGRGVHRLEEAVDRALDRL